MHSPRAWKFLKSAGVHQFLQVAVAIELRALVVKAMSHFMADDRAYATVIDGVVGVKIEEGG